jgi:hypothetical protein
MLDTNRDTLIKQAEIKTGKVLISSTSMLSNIILIALPLIGSLNLVNPQSVTAGPSIGIS